MSSPYDPQENQPQDTPSEPGRWAEGADAIQEMIADGLLDQNVYANPADIEALFDDAETHLGSADRLKHDDPRAVGAARSATVRP